MGFRSLWCLLALASGSLCDEDTSLMQTGKVQMAIGSDGSNDDLSTLSLTIDESQLRKLTRLLA